MKKHEARWVADRLRALGLEYSVNWDREYIVIVPSGNGSPGARLETLADAELLIHGLEEVRA